MDKFKPWAVGAALAITAARGNAGVFQRVASQRGSSRPRMMHDMSKEMKEMSGMMGKGMMMDADIQKQMAPMRKRMDEMMKESPMAPKKK